MFQLRVDDEIVLVLAEERHAQVMTDLILRNQARLARWEPWAEHPATLDGTRAYIRSALDDCPQPQNRAAAATLLGYANRSRAQIDALVHAANDTDRVVRNNAVRALGVLASAQSRTRKDPG